VPYLHALALLALLIRPVPAAAGDCVPAGRWVEPGTRAPLAAGAVLKRAARAPAVLLGERHDEAEHHRWQLHVLAALHGLAPDLAIGLEMMPRRVQPALDRWVAGESTVAEFLEESDWEAVWGVDPGLYLPILHFARMHGVPLVALNVERALTRRVAAEGWAAVPQAEREGLGDPAPAPQAYLDSLAEVAAEHGPDMDPARFVEAQLVWDRAMAEGIAAAHRNGGRPVVGIMGMGHVEHARGVAHQLAAMGVAGTLGLLPWDATRPCGELVPGVADAVFGVAPLPPDEREKGE
jgi:uncharacterized iron-regulated protein